MTRLLIPRLTVPHKYFAKSWVRVEANDFKIKVEIHKLNITIKELEKLLLAFSFVHKFYLYDCTIASFDKDIRLTDPGRK